MAELSKAIQRKLKQGKIHGGGGENMTMAPNMSTNNGPVYVPPNAGNASSQNMTLAPNMSTALGPAYVPPGGSQPTVYYPTGTSMATSYPSGQTSGGGNTPNGGGYSAGYSGSGDKPWITGESTPGVYKSGSFGSAGSPDLSNSTKVSEWLKFMQNQGYDTSGIDRKQLEQLSGRSGLQEYIASKLGSPQGSGALAGSTATATSSPSNAISRAMVGAESPTSTGTMGSIGRLLGINLENAGTAYHLPELGLSEGLAGGQTPLTGQTPESAKMFSPYRYTPENKIMGGTEAGTTPWGTDFTPGGAPQLVGQENLPAGGNLFDENTLGATTDRASTPRGNMGGGNYAQTAEVNDFLAEIMSAIMGGTAPELLAATDTSSMDAWYQEAMQQSGMTESQAALEAINKQIGVVSDLIDNLDADIAKEAGNFLMTEGQRRRLVATRGAPLRSELAKLAAGSSKYGVAIKDALGMLDQQIKLKQMQSTERLSAQKSVEESQQNKIKNMSSLLPYMTPSANEQYSQEEAMKRALLQSQTSKDVANINQGGDLF